MKISPEEAHLIPFPILTLSDFVRWYLEAHKETVSKYYVKKMCVSGELDYLHTEKSILPDAKVKAGKKAYYIVLNTKAKQPFINKRLTVYKGRKRSLRRTLKEIKEKGVPYYLPKSGADANGVFNELKKEARRLTHRIKKESLKSGTLDKVNEKAERLQNRRKAERFSIDRSNYTA